MESISARVPATTTGTAPELVSVTDATKDASDSSANEVSQYAADAKVSGWMPITVTSSVSISPGTVPTTVSGPSTGGRSRFETWIETSDPVNTCVLASVVVRTDASSEVE
jgi:hypothetical protein